MNETTTIFFLLNGSTVDRRPHLAAVPLTVPYPPRWERAVNATFPNRSHQLSRESKRRSKYHCQRRKALYGNGCTMNDRVFFGSWDVL